MTFAFDIDMTTSVEVHRDAGGHYKHHTVLVGSLRQGTMHIRDAILMPAVADIELVGVILGFDAFPQGIGSAISASEAPPVLAVAVRSPAPPLALLRAGIAQDLPADRRSSLLLGMLHYDPTIFFHYQKRDPRFLLRCRACPGALYHLPDVIPELQRLVHHADPVVVEGASEVLSLLRSQSVQRNSPRMEET